MDTGFITIVEWTDGTSDNYFYDSIEEAKAKYLTLRLDPDKGISSIDIYYYEKKDARLDVTIR